MRTYETIVVIDSLLKSEEIDAVIEKVTRIINNNGGKINSLDHWGKKRLAYEIKKRQYGYYIEIIFEAPGNIIKTLEREFRLDENILRYLSILLDRKAIKYIEDQRARQVKTVVENSVNNVVDEKVNDEDNDSSSPLEDDAEVDEPPSEPKAENE